MAPPKANPNTNKTKNKDSNDTTVQQLLAPKKDLPKGAQGNPPAKVQKRTLSDVSFNESMDSIETEITNMHTELKEIKTSLQGIVTKEDLNNLVKQNDLKEIVTTIVSGLLTSFKESITKEFETKLRDKTGRLRDEVDALNIENHQLKERLRKKDKEIDDLQNVVRDCNIRSMDALKLANYNEQYSRKHNIRMVNFPEKKGENLRDDFVNMVKKDLNVDIESADVVAIHRIPGKSEIRPVIAKVRNTEIKIKLMKNKKGLKHDVKFHDDITQRNLGLLTRLSAKDTLENSWFYNCSVYGKLKEGGKRMKFDLFDNVDEKIKKKLAAE